MCRAEMGPAPFLMAGLRELVVVVVDGRVRDADLLRALFLPF
jgi:regulator of RNase E activity RraA